MKWWSVVAITSAAAVLSSCGGKSAPPTHTYPLYLAAATNCESGDAGATFSPLHVSGSGYDVTVPASQGCTEGRSFTYWVFDVPLPSDGSVQIQPGNQPARTINAARVSASGAVTAYYARVSAGRYTPTTLDYARTVR